MIHNHKIDQSCCHLICTKMKLLPVTLDDLPLYEAMFGNEEYMKELGGIQPAEKIPGILQRQVNCVQSDKGWVFKIIPEPQDWKEGDENISQTEIAVGTVCVWTGYDDKRAVEISEMGYGVLPHYQGKGFASKAIRQVIDLARENGRWGVIHAYTNINNKSSIRLCEKVGFELMEECDMEYDGRIMPAKHFIIDTST